MDQSALKAALESHHPESFAWALHCCGRDPALAEDVLQTVYLKVVTERARFDGRSAFKTWLFAVIRRTAADTRRRRWLAWLGPGRAAAVPDPAADPAGALESTERRDGVLRGLAQLSERQRQVLMLVFYHNRSVEEAAAIMGIGVGSARTHYARGKARLRELLRQLGAGDVD